MLDMLQVKFHYYKDFLAQSQLGILEKVKDSFVLKRNQSIDWVF